MPGYSDGPLSESGVSSRSHDRETGWHGVPFLEFDEFPTYGAQRIHVVAANLDYAELSLCLAALDRRVSARSPRKPVEDPSGWRLVRQNNVNGSGVG